jgi:hypothetical protein
MANCKKLDIKPLPTEYKNRLVSFALKEYERKAPYSAVYQDYDTKDTNSIAYIKNKSEYEQKYGPSGGVKFWPLEPDMNIKIKEFYADTEIFDNHEWALQIVEGGNHVAPHVDDREARSIGRLYLLKAGGSTVRTEWWEPKEDWKQAYVPDYKGIPYNRLNLIESHILEEDNWYLMNFSQIHSVENQESLRIALSPIPPSALIKNDLE